MSMSVAGDDSLSSLGAVSPCGLAVRATIPAPILDLTGRDCLELADRVVEQNQQDRRLIGEDDPVVDGADGDRANARYGVASGGGVGQAEVGHGDRHGGPVRAPR